MSNNEVKKGGLSKNTMIIGAVVAVIAIWAISAYNGMVEKNIAANETWAEVQSAYQRRADLIPSLVNTVKGYAAHERGTFEAVTEARNRATQIVINADSITPEKFQEFQAAQNELSQALSRLLAITEAYPDLKANQNFLNLQEQLEGTENRINEARNTFNKAVQKYNEKVQKFPGNLLAGIFGFDVRSMFEADANAQKAPEVQF